MKVTVTFADKPAKTFDDAVVQSSGRDFLSVIYGPRYQQELYPPGTWIGCMLVP